MVDVAMASTGWKPPHHSFLCQESLYHNSGICQGSNILRFLSARRESLHPGDGKIILLQV